MECLVRKRRTLSTLLFAMMALNSALLNAQSLSFYFGGQTYASKGAAEAAMYSTHERNPNFTLETLESTSMVTLRYGYSAPDKLVVAGDWNLYLAGLGNHQSEQEAIDARVDYFENLLLQGACTNVLGHEILEQRSTWGDQLFFGGVVKQQIGAPKYLIRYECEDHLGNTSDQDFTFDMYRRRPVSCPDWYSFNFTEQICRLGGQLHITAPLNSENCGRGNPCIPATGDKYQRETDSLDASLAFTRSFHTQSSNDIAGFGKGWTHNFAQRLLLASLTTQEAVFVNASGFHIPVRFSSDSQAFLPFDGKSQFSIIKQADEWVMQRNSNQKRVFNESGRLIRIEEDQYQVNLVYDSDAQLVEVNSSYGHSLSFVYDENNRVIELEDSQGNLYLYDYSENDTLVAVIYPDETPNDDTDNPRRIYHYENSDYPNHLTGITDENGQRFATYTYDANGLAITTEHAQTSNPTGQEKIELDYQGAN